MSTTDEIDNWMHSLATIILSLIAFHILFDLHKEYLRRQQSTYNCESDSSSSKTLLAAGVDIGLGTSTVLAKSRFSLYSSSYTRRKVLRARVIRKSKRNTWPWKTPWPKENQSSRIIWKEEELVAATLNNSDIEQDEALDYAYIWRNPVIPYLFPFRRAHFWIDHIRYATKFTYQCNFETEYIPIPPYDIRLLDTRLGAPYIRPPGTLTHHIYTCKFGLKCQQDCYTFRWFHGWHNTRSIEAVRKAAREYHELKKAGCLEKGHALGHERCCENRVGKSWERTRKRCDMIYRCVEDSESARARKLRDIQRQAAFGDTDNEASLMSKDTKAPAVRMDDNKYLFYESITALQCAKRLQQYPATKEHSDDRRFMSDTFKFLFGFGYEEIWNKNPEDVKDMILFNWFEYDPDEGEVFLAWPEVYS